MIDVIAYEGDRYPNLQTQGFAAQYAFPFAEKMLNGLGLDVGCCKPEWRLPNTVPVDETFDDEYHALNLPAGDFDYIFSSHMLEHVDDWVAVLDYWGTKVNTIFLYLPHYDQKYWRPWNNRKHNHILTADVLEQYFKDRGYSEVIATKGYDLNHSFYVVASK